MKDNPNPTPPYFPNTLPVVCGITLEELVEMYKKYRSVKRLAEHLNFSTKATAKWLRIAGVKTIGHRPKKPLTPSLQTEYGAVGKWLKAHPGEKLPFNFKEAAKVVGCTPSAIRTLFHRKKLRAIKYLTSLGPLNKYDFTLESEDKRLVNVKFLDTFEYKMDSHAINLFIYGKVRTKDFIFKIPYAKLLHLIRESSKIKVDKWG